MINSHLLLGLNSSGCTLDRIMLSMLFYSLGFLLLLLLCIFFLLAVFFRHLSMSINTGLHQLVVQWSLDIHKGVIPGPMLFLSANTKTYRCSSPLYKWHSICIAYMHPLILFKSYLNYLYYLISCKCDANCHIVLFRE